MWAFLLLTALYSVSSNPTCSKGTIYNSDFNSCYKFVKGPNTYLDAEQNCVREGGHLASIRSEEENSFITNLVQTSGGHEDLFYWIGSNETDYSKWASGQNTLGGCSALTPCSGLWAKIDCSYSASYVCRIPPFTCPDCPSCPDQHSYCGSTWTYFEETDSCYKLSDLMNTSKLVFQGFFNDTWDEAEKTCRSHGSHLTSIHSNEENDFVFDLVTMGVEAKFDRDMTWFGLHRSSPGSSTFEFVDGTKFDPKVFNKWDPNEPNNTNNDENCVELTSDKRIVQKKGQKYDNAKMWNDSACAKRHRRFVCKKPAFHDWADTSTTSRSQ